MCVCVCVSVCIHKFQHTHTSIGSFVHIFFVDSVGAVCECLNFSKTDRRHKREAGSELQ